MAESDDDLLHRVAQRMEMAVQRVDEIVQAKPTAIPNDPNPELTAALRALDRASKAQRHMLDACWEIIPMLATEIDRLRSHDAS